MNNIEVWFNAHPLWHDCFLIVAPLIFGYIATKLLPFLWQLIKVQPKKLNTWVLRARLRGARPNLLTFYKLRNDTHYLIFYCFETLFLMASGILLFSLIGFVANLDTLASSFNLKRPTPTYSPFFLPSLFFSLFIIYTGSILAGVRLNKLAFQFRGGKRREQELINKYNTLMAKLQAKVPEPLPPDEELLPPDGESS
jgi:hypothetical protein